MMEHDNYPQKGKKSHKNERFFVGLFIKTIGLDYSKNFNFSIKYNFQW